METEIANVERIGDLHIAFPSGSSGATAASSWTRHSKSTAAWC
jgi:hypothetical protein